MSTSPCLVPDSSVMPIAAVLAVVCCILLELLAEVDREEAILTEVHEEEVKLIVDFL